MARALTTAGLWATFPDLTSERLLDQMSVSLTVDGGRIAGVDGDVTVASQQIVAVEIEDEGPSDA